MLLMQEQFEGRLVIYFDKGYPSKKYEKYTVHYAEK